MSARRWDARRISVVIPVYNGEKTLPLLVGRLATALPEHAACFEALLVDDGSRDGSWQVIGQLSQAHPWVRGIRLMRNYGQHSALLCGIRAARYDTLVTMDDDLQHPPEEIPRLLARLAEGYDVVYGLPIQPHHGWCRNQLSRLKRWLLHRVLGQRQLSAMTAFRAFRADLQQAFASYQGPSVMLDVLLSWGTTRFASVPVRHDPRPAGRSNYNPRRLLQQASALVMGLTTTPLRLALAGGLVLSAAGVCGLALALSRHLADGPGAARLQIVLAVAAVFSGAQLLAIGVMGEYVGHVFSHSLGRPVYLIRESLEPVTPDARAGRAPSAPDEAPGDRCLSHAGHASAPGVRSRDR